MWSNCLEKRIGTYRFGSHLIIRVSFTDSVYSGCLKLPCWKIWPTYPYSTCMLQQSHLTIRSPVSFWIENISMKHSYRKACTLRSIWNWPHNFLAKRLLCCVPPPLRQLRRVVFIPSVARDCYEFEKLKNQLERNFQDYCNKQKN